MSLTNLTLQKLMPAVLVALTLFAPGASLAQSDYDRHVVFDNSLPDRSLYRSQGSFVSPSELELADSKLPVAAERWVTPPNCLRLKWRSRALCFRCDSRLSNGLPRSAW